MGRQGKHPEPGWKERFLDAYEQFGTAFKACKVAGVSRDTAFRHKREDEEFRAQWEELEEESTDRLEASCYERAVDGWDEPVYQNGKQIAPPCAVLNMVDAAQLVARRSVIGSHRLPEVYNGDGMLVGALAKTARMVYDSRPVTRYNWRTNGC